MLEEPPDYALVNRPKESLVNGNILVKNSPDTQIGDRYYNVTLICPNSDSEVTLKPGLLESAVEKANGLDEKTDSDEVCIANDQKFRIRKLHVLAGATALVLIAVVATLAVLLSPTKHHGSDPPPDLGNDSLTIVTRGEWFALPRTGPVDNMAVQPAPYIIIGEATNNRCYTKQACSNVMRMIQLGHTRDFHYVDIGFNFLIGGDGSAYEGRGWDNAGAHTLRLNNRSMGINFIGLYSHNIPSEKMLRAFHKLVDLGIELNKISANFTIFTHRQIRNSSSPGIKFYELIKTWPQWREYDALKDIPPYNNFI